MDDGALVIYWVSIMCPPLCWWIQHLLVMGFLKQETEREIDWLATEYNMMW